MKKNILFGVAFMALTGMNAQNVEVATGDYNPDWESPKKDIIRGWADACDKYGLPRVPPQLFQIDFNSRYDKKERKLETINGN